MMNLGCVFDCVYESVCHRAYALVSHRACGPVVDHALLHGDYQTETDLLWLELFLCLDWQVFLTTPAGGHSVHYVPIRPLYLPCQKLVDRVLRLHVLLLQLLSLALHFELLPCYLAPVGELVLERLFNDFLGVFNDFLVHAVPIVTLDLLMSY